MPASTAKLVLTETMVSPSQTRQPLHGGVGEVAHAVDFELGAARVANVEHDAGQRQPDDEKACQRHRQRQPSGRQRRRGTLR